MSATEYVLCRSGVGNPSSCRRRQNVELLLIPHSSLTHLAGSRAVRGSFSKLIISIGSSVLEAFIYLP